MVAPLSQIRRIILHHPHRYGSKEFMSLFCLMENYFMGKTGQTLQDYNISAQFTQINTSKNTLVHLNEKQHKSRHGDVMYEICCRQNMPVINDILLI